MEREELVKAVSDAISLEKCASEALLIPEFVENWNRLRPKFQISVMPMNRTPIQAMVDRACQVPPVLWSEETRVEFFRFVEKCIRIPVLEKMLASVDDLAYPDCLTA
jgi:hypothetical protein